MSQNVDDTKFLKPQRKRAIFRSLGLTELFGMLSFHFKIPDRNRAMIADKRIICCIFFSSMKDGRLSFRFLEKTVEWYVYWQFLGERGRDRVFFWLAHSVESRA